MNKLIDAQVPLNGHVDAAIAHFADTVSGRLPMGRRAWLRQAGLAAAAPWLATMASAAETVAVKRPPTTGVILCYRGFADKTGDRQAVLRATLAEHIKAIKTFDAHVINLVDLVANHAGRLANLPPRAVVLSVDDCDRGIVDVLMPQLHGSDWQVTLFITPNHVGQGKRVLSWDELSGLHHSGRFSVQARTLSGADLVQAHRNRSDEAFEKFIAEEMQSGKDTIQNRLVKPVSFQAWPAGAFDQTLMKIAEALEFQASFALGDRPASLGDPKQAIPRFVMHDGIKGKQLTQMLKDAFPA
jgi:hypothetical protein